ncbi:hypothetical protein BDB00DRAFT_834904 [Zychaea mexicana]|uniref:uncharacterized protein n=1 Tax=Zychaea mexicana TaxID=64656 RepID=UPI0022FDC1DB|nr:uncharacterized protein BDB00DRAFT_834904 [Zychaea mexicana]KAI9491034.1 hypothetical protein BDB00DRAFT_834904 [Zychaea mexicana]
MADQDLERYFSQSEKQLEIERVLQCFKLDPFSILELPYGKLEAKQIKMQYRKKSLMIHPDKVKHDRAEEAFSMLKKAESELNDDTKVKFLLSVIEEAKVEALRDNGYKVKTQVVASTTDPKQQQQQNDDGKEEDQEEGADKDGSAVAGSTSTRKKTVIESATSVDSQQYPFLKTQNGQQAVRAKVKEILIEMELRRRRQLKKEMEAEGKEARKAEEEANSRKRQRDEQKQWEATRDQRVNSWRDFQKKGGRKVKKVKKSGL